MKVCSNYYLIGQFQMKTGKFEEALKSLDKAFGLMDGLKAEFKEDIYIVRSKFYTTRANTHFILGNYKEAHDAAESGMKDLDQITQLDVSIIRASKQTHRDLHNIKVRSLAKLTNKSVAKIREENPVESVSERMQRAQEAQRNLMLHKFAFLANHVQME